MKSYAGKLAVLTGGGSGIGRELVILLAAEGCSVAMCDLNGPAMEETRRRAMAVAKDGVRVTSHIADITDEAAVERFRDEVLAQHETDHVNLLFNNAGIFGAGSFLEDDRAAWERVYAVCWYGVYYPCRVFVPLVVAAEEGHVINTASVNALRATHGPGTPSTSYSAGKWAVRGFTEALIEDFKTHAPHVGVSLVMPGGVGTAIRANSQKIIDAASAEGKANSGTGHLRSYLVGMGVPVQDSPESTIQHLLTVQQSDVFAMPPPRAARQVLDGVLEGRWRIFIGIGAVELDAAVRAEPERIYDADAPSLINRDLLIGIMTLSSERFQPEEGGPADGLYEFHLDSTPIFGRVAGGRALFTRDCADKADVVVKAELPTFSALILKQEDLDSAIAKGQVTISGDKARVQQLLDAVRV
ncbi:SDR family NAD(P)-dependent oxidoreductase [Flavisphingomonas formosensis]|uniref:SDR family NAD(P)-dependent oxidoreductase n=1 Tax=Flavisphingomonas formosensis TaxID=861534 RepID=UPI0018DFFBBA|nr:SDR family NAD(P)-dependent oxidoreductase [Sphingomonas formosensis]